MAFTAFAKVEADIVLLEVGMGGRSDVTNIIEHSILSVITNISLDHTDVLGDSIEEIAYEKSGIMRPNSSCVIGRQEESARKILEQYAIKKRTSVFREGFDWQCESHDDHIEFSCGGELIELPLPSLAGKHQIANAGIAVAATTLLRNKYGFEKIECENIAEGLQNTYWPARLEKIENCKLANMFPEGWENNHRWCT